MEEGFYRLAADGETPVPCDVDTFGRMDRRVANDTVAGQLVSTVFLGINHRFGGEMAGPPILWETMIFGGPLDGTQERYTSHAAALAGHERWRSRVREIATAKALGFE